jgi:hypothetical protein
MWPVLVAESMLEAQVSLQQTMPNFPLYQDCDSEQLPKEDKYVHVAAVGAAAGENDAASPKSQGRKQKQASLAKDEMSWLSSCPAMSKASFARHTVFVVSGQV